MGVNVLCVNRDSCGDYLRPHVLLPSELPDKLLYEYEALQACACSADLVLVIGVEKLEKSMQSILQAVYKAGKTIVEINEQSKIDQKGVYWIEGDIESILKDINKKLTQE